MSLEAPDEQQTPLQKAVARLQVYATEGDHQSAIEALCFIDRQGQASPAEFRAAGKALNNRAFGMGLYLPEDTIGREHLRALQDILCEGGAPDASVYLLDCRLEDAPPRIVVQDKQPHCIAFGAGRTAFVAAVRAQSTPEGPPPSETFLPLGLPRAGLRSNICKIEGVTTPDTLWLPFATYAGSACMMPYGQVLGIVGTNTELRDSKTVWPKTLQQAVLVSMLRDNGSPFERGQWRPTFQSEIAGLTRIGLPGTALSEVRGAIGRIRDAFAPTSWPNRDAGPACLAAAVRRWLLTCKSTTNSTFWKKALRSCLGSGAVDSAQVAPILLIVGPGDREAHSVMLGCAPPEQAWLVKQAQTTPHIVAVNLTAREQVGFGFALPGPLLNPEQAQARQNLWLALAAVCGDNNVETRPFTLACGHERLTVQLCSHE